MKRLLAGVVTAQLVLSGLALIAVSGGGIGPIAAFGPFSATGRGESTDVSGDRSGTGEHRRHATSTSAGGRTTGARGAFGPADAVGRRGQPENGISFQPAVDFATGASPSSEEFNKREGEQTGPMVEHRWFSDSVVTGDFNGDGRADVIQSNVLAGSLSVFLGNGRGGFASPVVHPVGINPNFVEAGDLDGDGRLDLAVADTGAESVFILRGDGKGDFAMLRSLPVYHPRNVAIGRIDGDGIPDLAIAAAGPVCTRLIPACADAPSVGGVHTFVGLGGGAFRPWQVIPLTHSDNSRPVGANFVALHDYDGDGLGDVAVTVGTTTMAFDRAEGKTKLTGDDLLVFLNRGGALPFGVSPDQPAIRIGGQPDAIAVGDWNGDTHPDLAVLETGSGTITSLVGNGRGRFDVKATNRSVGGVPRSLTVGDFNGDRVPDLVTVMFAASTASVLAGNGDGTFQPAVDYWAGNAPTSAAVGNFDGDNSLDIVVGRLRTDTLSLFVNDGPKRGDGVVVHRDIPYGSPTHPNDDPFPTKHTLDVYVPPKGTSPFAGAPGAYPVVFFAHGGLRNNNKSFTSYLLRSLSAQGMVAVSTDFRLGFQIETLGPYKEQVQDVAQAFRWVRDNIGSPPYGGDARNIVLFGESFGGDLLNRLATYPEWTEEQKRVRGLALAGCAEPGAAAKIPEALFLSGDESIEADSRQDCESRAATWKSRGAKATYVQVLGRDHFTLLANLALTTDPGRVALDAFLREQMNRPIGRAT